MYKHIILFRFKTHLKNERCLELLVGLKALKNIIPEIKGFHFGINDKDNLDGNGYEYAVIIEFESKIHRDTYQNHPSHQEYINCHLNQHIDYALVFDMVCY